MISFNSFLLYTFARNIRLGSDVQSFLKRYQILSIIYVHLTLLLVVFGYGFIVGIILGYQDAGIFSPISFIFVSLSAHFLFKGKIEHSAGVMVPYMHCLNFVAGAYANRPMVALSALMLFPHFTFFISSSKKVRNLNFLLCALQAVHHTYKIKEIFNFGLTDDQAVQINTFLLVSFVYIGSICVGCVVEKSVETSLWKMAQTNQENSEQLTKEVVQAAAAKDAFVSSLSHEIRNPLNSLTISIDFLMETVKDPKSLHILKNAKLSGEVLLNLVNNVLDAAKLRSEKMEIASIEVHFDSIINKVFTINSENLKRGGVTAKAEIDKKLPKSLWMDPSRFLQIFMNLMSNALKFTSKDGNIHILVKWCPPSTQRENLLLPIDSKLLDSLTTGKGAKTPQKKSPEKVDHFERQTGGLDIERISSEIFEEFSFEEGAQRQNNLNNMKEFTPLEDLATVRVKVRGLEDLINADHLYSEQEPWSIYRTSLDKETASEVPQKASENGYLQVQITDTGRGIPKENIGKLFGMFIQAHGTSGIAYHGTGLGLWICKQLCNKMGGDITVYSEENRGTSFVFYIPVDNQRIINEGKGPGQYSNKTRESVHVLIADDYQHNRELHKLLLEREGAVVSLATNGKEAVQKYKEKNDGYYDFILTLSHGKNFFSTDLHSKWPIIFLYKSGLLPILEVPKKNTRFQNTTKGELCHGKGLMDVQMPEMDGFTAAKEIRAWEGANGWRKSHVYFVSGEYYNEDEVLASLKRSQARDVNMDGLFSLRKPMDIQIIRGVLDKYKKDKGETLNGH